jgi:hypothetical protein
MEFAMYPAKSPLHFAVGIVLVAALANDASAAAQRTFVASTGNDANACSLAAPCRSFLAAIAQTLSGGEVIVLDSAGYGPVTVTQPVSIIAPPGVYAGVSVFDNAGITINAGAGAKVTLRGLTINGLGGVQGVLFNSGDALYMDGVIVSGFTTGLAVATAASASVFVTDAAFRDNATGASFTASSGTLSVSIERTLFERNATGATFADRTVAALRGASFVSGANGLAIAAAAGGSKVELRDSTLSGNSGTALAVGPAASATVASIVGSLLSANGTGIGVQGAGNSAYVSDTTITRNTTGVSATGGTLVSAGDNRLANNTTNGTFTSTLPKQ